MQIETLNARSIILAIFVVFTTLAYTQAPTDRPKVGLVLSGGGAKGFAHVGVLKVLEQHHIPIDYIGGTSIGAIVGGLYSIGYTAQQLEDMVLTQDWEAMFIDDPERIFLPFYEKNDQKRYQISMQLKDHKLQIPNYALSNNGIVKLFSDLTIGYHDVNDFSKLPIPFLCVAVDLQTGNEVMIDSGYLPDAMAASMALPGIFPNVKTKGKILVDGGLRNNLPVDHIRAMGADIIIGVDVGSGIKTGDDLDHFSVVVEQLMNILANEKFEANRADCDVYILPDIPEFSPADFTTEAAIELFARGKQKAEEHLDEIMNVEKLFDQYTLPQHEAYLGIDSLHNRVVKHFDINTTSLSDKAVLTIMGIKGETNTQCTIKELQVGLKRLHASMLFSKVHYKLDEGKEANSYHLKLDLQDNTESFINFGARYNNQDAVSLLFNGTFNNLLFKNSRLSLDLKISEVPALNIRYNINQGSLPGLGLQYGYRRRVMLNYDEGQRVGEGSVAKRYFDVISNSVVEDYFTIGIGIRYENYKIDDILGTFALDEGRYNYLLYRSFLEIDTKDKAYYPTRGIKCYLHTDAITDNGFELNNKMPSITSFLSINNTCSFNNFWALTTSVSAQLQYVNSNPPPPLYDTYVGGSFQANDILSLIPFWGLRWGEYRANNIVALGAENRFKVADKHYLYLNANVLANSETLDNISASSLDYKLGFAVGYSYDSFVGPIELFLSLSDDMSLGNYINIGYYF